MNHPSVSSATPIPPGLHRTNYQLPPAPQYPPLPSSANLPSSPPIEDVNLEGSSATGMELTVVSLDHTSPTSAKTHLERLLRQIQQQKDVPDVIIHKGDVSGNLDYMHVSLCPTLSPVPRPNILQQLLSDINDLHQGAVHTKWRAGWGADKNQISNLGGRLRISFDLLHSEDIDTMLTAPPYVNHHTYHPTRPHFVEPTYGGKIAIGGCEVLQNPQAQFNMELRKKYGQDVVCFSCVTLEGSTYTVVLRDWQTTNQFLEDFGEGLPSSWTRFRNITVGVPDLLYLFNSVGAPANPLRGATSSSPQVSHLQVQVDELRRQGAETVGTVNQVLAKTWRAVDKQNEAAQQMMASICAVSTSAALSSRYASLESTGGHLEECMIRYWETLKGKPSTAQRVRIKSLLAETESSGPSNDVDHMEQESLLAFALHISSNAFVILFSLLLLIMVVHAFHPLHFVSLNTNGLEDLMKCNAISSMIQQHRPHIWVINETKSPTPVVSHVCAHGYNTFENPGMHTAGSPAHGKWGVILGVSNTIHAQHVDTSFDSSLTGRVVAVELVIPTAHGGFPHRLISVYAPWDPGMTAGPDPHSSSVFWTSITQLCQHSPYSWSLIGDCNVTLNISETSSWSTSLSQAQLQYRTFLHDCHAVDIWDTQNDVDAAFTYTFHNHIGQSVIDRAVHSTVGVQSSEIEVLDFFIGSTDHRPIRALLSMSTPDGQSPLFPSSLMNSSNQRVQPLYPKCHEHAHFIAFANEVDHQVLLCGLSGITVADDSSFDVLYHALTDIICNAASLHFEQPQWMTQKEGSAQKIVNPTIRILVCEGHRLGRLIAATRGHSISELATKAPWVVDYLNAHANILIAQGDCAPQFLPYLLTLHRTLAQIHYAKERIELHSRAQQSAQGHIRAVLLGSSAKRLYPWIYNGGPPLALVHPEDRLKFFTTPKDIHRETQAYFTNFFTRQEHPGVQKTWMETPSVVAIKS
ncbi:hypothetical protein BDR05DRAFT_952885 [Suillus weaverae]|nr:hypothetical protein BDR05DRAFT_952885 [Suillus weaverae]